MGRAVGRPRQDEADLALKQGEILDAAAHAFMDQGFAATTIDRVAERLGATKGAVYYYYRSKSDLFFAVHRRAMELTRDALLPAASGEGGPRDRLRRMAHAHALLMMEQLPYLRVAAQGLELHLLGRTTADEREGLREIAAMRDANERFYVGVIEEGAAAGVFRAVDARLTAKPVLGALNWTSRWYQPRRGETAADRNRIAEELATFVVQALAP